MKVEDTYSSVIRGVSQQSPADRLEGQHGEQLNMISDAVRGLVRRNGMIMDAQSLITFTSDAGDAVADSFSYRTYTFRDNDVDYDLLYRGRERTGALTDAHLDALILFDKTNRAFLPVVRPAVDARADLYESGGFSAIGSLGSYLLFAANGVAPNYNVIDNVAAGSTTAAIWIRGGANSRKYKISLRRASDHAPFSVEYTTPAAAYQGILDFSTIPPGVVGSPSEQYYVNTIQAAYDTNVNQWAASSAAAIVPSAIAAEIIDLFNAAGFTGWQLNGSTMLHDNIEWVEASDGGDGTFIRAVLNEVESAEAVTTVHRVGKVVMVQPKDNRAEPFYLRAEAKTSGSSATYQEVVWREAAGDTQLPVHILSLGRIVNGTLYWASSAAALDALVLAETAVVIDSPDYEPSKAGDVDSLPAPHFFNRRITLIQVYLDRLILGSNSVMSVSKQGDYFNFYRSSMLTIPADDATEFYAVGTESDVVRQSIVYDNNLMIQGDKFHYSINGKEGIDAANPKMQIAFSLEGAAYAAPVGAGKHVFVLKQDDQLAASRLMQIQAGLYQDSPDIGDVSVQLRDYINGTPAEMVAVTNPSTVFVRTEHFLKSAGGFPRARPWGFYVYQYYDDRDGKRLFDSWSAWEWSTALGTPIGMSSAIGGSSLLLYTVAFGADQDGNRARAVYVQRASARSDPTGLPYLDGLRPAVDAEASGLLTPQAVVDVQESVFTSPGAAHSYAAVPTSGDASRFIGLEHPHYTLGDAPPESVDEYRWTGVQGWATDYAAAFPDAPVDNLWTGTAFPAYVDITNPFVRNREGKIKEGRLNLISYYVTLTRTAGFTSSWIDYDGTTQVQGFDGTYSRIKYHQPVWVGRESKDVQVRLSAVSWLPLTIESLAYQGDWFGKR
jgi:hypothetical protein